MDTINLIVYFALSVGLLYSLRRARKDDEKLADAIIQIARQVKRLEKYVFPPHDQVKQVDPKD